MDELWTAVPVASIRDQEAAAAASLFTQLFVFLNNYTFRNYFLHFNRRRREKVIDVLLTQPWTIVARESNQQPAANKLSAAHILLCLSNQTFDKNIAYLGECQGLFHTFIIKKKLTTEKRKTKRLEQKSLIYYEKQRSLV